MATEYFSGQGIMKVALITNGVVGPYRDVQNVPSLSISTSVTKKEHKESRSGQRATDKTLITEKKITFKATLDGFGAKNLAFAFQGTISDVVSGTVTNETVGTGTLAVGQEWALANPKASAVVLKDSTNKTLVLGTDYSVNEVYGTITLLNVTGITAPIKAAYSYAARTSVNLVEANVEGYRIRFEGLNTADGDRPVLITLFKADVDPAKVLDLIQDDFGKLEVEGGVLKTDAGTVRYDYL